MSSVLVLDRISRRFRTRAEQIDAVVDASFRIEPGSMVGLVGPSGSGKTTLLNLIAGWDLPDDGEIHRPGTGRDDWNRIAVVPQGIGLLDELTLIDNIELPIRLGNEQRTSVSELMEHLALTGLGLRTPPEVSVGEQQRTAVARAVVVHPALLVADEPTAHQDEANAYRVMEVLASCTRTGSGVLVSTHDERVLPWLTRTLRIESGRVSEG